MPGWTQILITILLISTVVYFIAMRSENKKTSNPPSNPLEGLTGWLILVGFGVVVSPIKLIVESLQYYNDANSDADIMALTNPDSLQYNSDFALLLNFEMIFNILSVLAALYLVCLFFTKKSLFPKLFIAITLINLVVLLLEPFAVLAIFPELSYRDMFDQDMVRGLASTLVSLFIWVPYMLVSKRVKATFIND